MRIIKETWGEFSYCDINEKLHLVKGRLKEWNRKEFGHIDQTISSLETTIHEIDQLASTRNLTETELNERRKAQLDLWSWLKRKDMFWAQNSRAKWIREGDKNTRYFHVIASMHRRQNSITSLSTNGVKIVDPAVIKEEAVSLFLL